MKKLGSLSVLGDAGSMCVSYDETERYRLTDIINRQTDRHRRVQGDGRMEGEIATRGDDVVRWVSCAGEENSPVLAMSQCARHREGRGDVASTRRRQRQRQDRDSDRDRDHAGLSVKSQSEEASKKKTQLSLWFLMSYSIERPLRIAHEEKKDLDPKKKEGNEK